MGLRLELSAQTRSSVLSQCLWLSEFHSHPLGIACLYSSGQMFVGDEYMPDDLYTGQTKLPYTVMHSVAATQTCYMYKPESICTVATTIGL